MRYVNIESFKTFKLWSIMTDSGPRETDELFISAHGVRSTQRNEFPISSGIQLFFYAPDKTVLRAPPLEHWVTGIHRGDILPREVRTISSPDYFLSKFQGFRSTISGALLGALVKPIIRQEDILESYKDVENAVLGPNEQQLVDPTKDDDWGVFDDVQEIELDGNRPVGPRNVDILTIRAGFGKRHSRLSEILESLERCGRHYRIIHCGFCRSGYKWIDDNYDVLSGKLERKKFWE